jgi:acyl-coenzyme A synthetase/AMP-(fatty) acid ligase
VGRVDHQVKVHGHRVELGEIEAVAREVGGLPAAVCLPWTFTEAGADTLALVLDRAPPDGLFAAMAERLPGYMVPRELRVVAAFPLNANGKIDRAALRALLERA